MDKIQFSDGTKISNAKVTIDNVDYTVTPARYNGATPLSSIVLNTMQNNIEDAIDLNAANIGGEEYDSTATYYEGDTCIYDNLLYRALQDIDTPEEWNAEHWEETSVIQELANTSGNEIAYGLDNITRQSKAVVYPTNYRTVNQEVNIGATNPSNIRTWFKQGKNLVNKQAWFFGYFGNTGSMNYSKNNATFNFIEVLPNTSYTFSVSSNTTWFAITEFNNSTFIRRDAASSYPASQLTITTSATTNYIAISLNHSDSQMTQAKIDEREPQLELGTTATTYEDFITPEIITNNDNIFYTAPNEKWERLTLSSEFKNYNNDIAYQPKIKKEGNVVTIIGIVSPTADITNTSTEHTICNIPEQYRPRDIPVHQVCQASGINRWLLIVGINGNVTLSRYGIAEMTTALANSWLPFTITYLV